MKAHSMTILLLATVLLSAVATPATSAEDARKEVETLFRLTHMEDKIRDGVHNVAQMQVRMNPVLADRLDILMEFLDKYVGWQAVHDELADMYLQAFSVEELRAMNAFYETPAGQKVITLVPQLVQKQNQQALQRLQQHLGELQSAINSGK